MVEAFHDDVRPQLGDAEVTLPPVAQGLGLIEVHDLAEILALHIEDAHLSELFRSRLMRPASSTVRKTVKTKRNKERTRTGTGTRTKPSADRGGQFSAHPQSHNAFAYRPGQRPGYEFQQNYGPFTTCGVLTAGQLCVLCTVQLPTSFLQNLGIFGTMRFTFDVTSTPSTTGTATRVDVEIGDITDFSTGTPLIICNGKGDITTTGTAAVIYHEVCEWTVNHHLEKAEKGCA